MLTILWSFIGSIVVAPANYTDIREPIFNWG